MEILLKKEIIAPILIILFSILIYKIIKNIMKKLLIHNRYGNIKKNKTFVSLINNILKYLIVFIDILMILEVYGIDTKAILASLGVGVAVLGLALQDLIKDFISGLFIVFEDQFRVGDYITTAGFKGEVIALGLKSTKIKAYTGEVKIISNRLLTDVINYNMRENLALVDVSVSYSSDLNKVDEVLTNFCKRMTRELPNIEGEVTLLGVEELASSMIVYRITVPCKPMAQYEIQRKIRKEVKLELDAHNIVIPYPQVVIHHE